MSARLTVTLHELVAELDIYADALLHERYGVSYNLFEFLTILHSMEPTDITGLARCLRVSKAAVSKRVPGLVEGGWVTASADPGHGRRVVLTLTEKAQQLVATAGRELDDEFAALLADPRLDPAHSQGAIAPHALHSHLSTLLQIITENGRPD